ncbi:MAG: tRNA uridine-5-carboxymethylaminomethyl(34) synthesis GTPase MnmE [Burkholderiaceae bacterium]|nr:tRNA uridine-5-carboxymethylaminomethyl(34) synthesis GTPase MnmE [Burkholderiaceae bacterium]
MIDSDDDPIVAIATASGRSGIGVVRLSGAHIEPIVEAVLGVVLAAKLRPRHATRARFLDQNGRVIDDGIAILYRGPNSYTGQDVLELQGHGGPTVQRMLLARCLEAGRAIGARLAQPGEFTRRAFLNDRIDLAQAEAVADLIDASTEAAARSASRSLTGEFSNALSQLAERLTQARALIEACLDFPEEDLEQIGARDVRERVRELQHCVDDVMRRARLGAVLRDGLRAVLVGAPNVGKSSLLNALAGQDVAIVTPHPGTTRDRIERSVDIGSVVVNFIDTAGLRPTADEVERLGIDRTLAAVAESDLVLELVDATGEAGQDSHDAHDARLPFGADCGTDWRKGIGSHASHLLVVNKIDLSGDAPGLRDGRMYVSAKTGAGLDSLREELLRRAGWEHPPSDEGVYLARARHLDAIARTQQHLQQALSQLGPDGARPELAAEELRLAQLALGQITGQVVADDILGEIFSRFCIGK